VNRQTGGLTHPGTVTSRNARWRSLSPSPPDAGRRRGTGRGCGSCSDSPFFRALLSVVVVLEALAGLRAWHAPQPQPGTRETLCRVPPD